MKGRLKADFQRPYALVSNRIFNQLVLRKDINLFRNQPQFFAFGDLVTRGIAACQRDMHVLFVVFYHNMRQCADGVDFFDFGADHRGFVFGGKLPFVRTDVADSGLFLPFVVRVQFPREAVVMPDAFFDASFKCVSSPRNSVTKAFSGLR